MLSSKEILTTKTTEQAAKLPQYIAAISVTWGGLVMGSILGWSSPAGDPMKNGDLGIPVTAEEADLASSLVAVGAMVGALVGGPSADVVGRKLAILCQILPGLVGWALVIWPQNVAMLFAGRILLGFTSGFFTVVAPLYTTEISEISVRGVLGTFFQLQVTIGILFENLVGAFVSVCTLSAISAIFPVISFVCMLFMPESPKFLLTKGKRLAAEKALQRLRGSSYDITNEIALFESDIKQAASRKVSLSQAFVSTAAKKGLVIGIGIMFFQQFSGINAVIFNTVAIFKAAGIQLDPNISSIIVSAVSVIATYISSFIIDRSGRKPLLIGSDAIMALSSAALGLYFYLGNTDLGWLPLVSLIVFIIVFSLGFGPIPWMFMSEIFPPEINGPACSIASLFNWIFVFIVTMSFNRLIDAVGNAYTYWIFSILSALGTVFVFLIVPETKGKSIETIVAELS